MNETIVLTMLTPHRVDDGVAHQVRLSRVDPDAGEIGSAGHSLEPELIKLDALAFFEAQFFESPAGQFDGELRTESAGIELEPTLIFRR